MKGCFHSVDRPLVPEETRIVHEKRRKSSSSECVTTLSDTVVSVPRSILDNDILCRILGLVVKRLTHDLYREEC